MRGVFAANKDKIDVVITDLMMPIMDGHSLIAAIRRIVPAARVVAVSGIEGSAEIIKTANVGFDDFLTKPFSADALLKALRNVLQRPRRVSNQEPGV